MSKLVYEVKTPEGFQPYMSFSDALESYFCCRDEFLRTTEGSYRNRQLKAEMAEAVIHMDFLTNSTSLRD